MSGRNRVYIGIAALVLVGLALVIGLLLLTNGGVPHDISAVLTPTASETPQRPTLQPTESPTLTVASGAEPTQTPQSTPTHEPDAGDEPTETPQLIPPIPFTPTNETHLNPESATTIAQATQAEIASGTGSETPPPTPIEVAFAPILIRSDVSGNVIGDGTLRIYAPSSVQAPQTLRVELELNLDNQYITPTPIGNAGTPVPRSTQVSNPGGATATPYSPIVTDQGLPVYQRMGATLLCAAESFAGCDGQRDPTQAKLITSRTTTWSWILTPAEGASGAQDLRIEVWITQFNLDGRIEYLDVPNAHYPFSVEIKPAGGISPLLLAIIAVAGVLIVGFVVMQRRQVAPKPAPAASIPTPVPSTTKPPLVFISYRRGTSWGQARSIEQSLRQRGADVFIDVDDINEGKFAETIQKAITDCDFFLPVLAPGTLESEWVRREIAYAIQLKKTIVPLLIDGFTLDEAHVPLEIAEIASHNAIRVLPEFYEEAMDRLAKRFLGL
ncbi:MAG: TIR domain-containing protein [Chloroflexota bacterium]